MSNTVQLRWIGNVFFIAVTVTFTNALACRTPPNCCIRYHTDGNTSRCIECMPGYFGTFCSQLCLYPFYGRGCQSMCSCDVSDCDYVQGCRKKVSSSEAVSNVSPTELMNQDTSMLSKQTTLTEEFTQREKELYLSYQEDKSWHKNKVLFYFIIGLLFIAVLLVCLHIILCFVD
ncbi:uncharacterized protein LOC128184943 [Crassostrea angulata]|uniref:uncharacterized protein LOC128184943 n=1 Tax=Magallana angulata TaxID=2784310 RepID=UPI0022B19020|nr:uncharacterized protein LOC128184943 [Crassostrea angulata]